MGILPMCRGMGILPMGRGMGILPMGDGEEHGQDACHVGGCD